MVGEQEPMMDVVGLCSPTPLDQAGFDCCYLVVSPKNVPRMARGRMQDQADGVLGSVCGCQAAFTDDRRNRQD
jgi:hypothetical protein